MYVGENSAGHVKHVAFSVETARQFDRLHLIACRYIHPERRLEYPFLFNSRFAHINPDGATRKLKTLSGIDEFNGGLTRAIERNHPENLLRSSSRGNKRPGEPC
jgi:hypothetical protein